MKILGLLCLFLASANLLLAQQQTLTKKWDARFGGLTDDEMYSCIQTSDGGVLLGGGSYSGTGGDKTQDNRDLTCNTSDF